MSNQCKTSLSDGAHGWLRRTQPTVTQSRAPTSCTSGLQNACPAIEPRADHLPHPVGLRHQHRRTQRRLRTPPARRKKRPKPPPHRTAAPLAEPDRPPCIAPRAGHRWWPRAITILRDNGATSWRWRVSAIAAPGVRAPGTNTQCPISRSRRHFSGAPPPHCTSLRLDPDGPVAAPRSSDTAGLIRTTGPGSPYLRHTARCFRVTTTLDMSRRDWTRPAGGSHRRRACSHVGERNGQPRGASLDVLDSLYCRTMGSSRGLSRFARECEHDALSRSRQPSATRDILRARVDQRSYGPSTLSRS